MPNKTTSEVKAIVFDAASIPQRTTPPLAMAHTMDALSHLSMGDSGGIALLAGDNGLNPTITDAWYNQLSTPMLARLTNLQDVQFVRFCRDGTVKFGAAAFSGDTSEVSGYFIVPNEVFLDLNIDDSTLTGGNTAQHWSPLSGTWKTCKPPQAPLRTCILNTGSDLLAQAQTVATMPANRGHRVDIRCMAHGNGGPQPGIRHIFGKGKYSVAGRDGQKPTFEKMVNGSWKLIRSFDASAPVNLANGRYILRVFRIGGRAVVQWNDVAYWMCETTQPASGSTKIAPAPISWDAGQLLFNAWNCKVQLGLATIQWCDAGAVPFPGSLSVTQPHADPVDSGSLKCFAGGWRSLGTSISPTIRLNSGQVTIAIEMVASPDGIDTPLITRVLAVADAGWTTPTRTSIDISQTVTNWTVSGAIPPLMPGMEFSIDVDRSLLDKLFSGTWQNYVKPFNPIEIYQRWHYDDGSVDPWYYLAAGYIWKPEMSTSGLNQNTMTITGHDSIQRLSKPFAVIDHRDAPLDVTLANLGLDASSFARIFGSDLVNLILQNHSNPHDGQSVTVFYPSDMYPLLSYDSDILGMINGLPGFVPFSNVWRFSPPVKRDAIGWISDIGKLDRCVFCKRWPTGYNFDAPAFQQYVYGRIPQIIANAFLYTIQDTVLTNLSGYALMQSGSVTRKPESEINRVLVSAHLPGDEALQDLFPTARVAVYQLPDSDPNSAILSGGERTLVVNEDVGGYLGAAEAIGSGIIQQLLGFNNAYPKLTLTHGIPYLQWGDVIQPSQVYLKKGDSPDLSMGITGVPFRLEKIVHKGKQNLTYTLDCWGRGLTAEETASISGGLTRGGP